MKTTFPETEVISAGRRPITASPRVLFPQPLSPTMLTFSPAFTLKDMCESAVTTPIFVLKRTVRS